MKFRDLNKDEIECRVATVNEKGCSLLLYKDARCDMNILDETLGVTGWRRSHEIIGGNLFCTVEVYDDQKKEWIYKQDVGVESYTEKEKGQASDSFKRACFNLGIGRELYTAPFIWIAVILSLCGLYLLCLTPGEGFAIGKGELLVLICAFLFSLHILTIDHFSPLVDGVKMSCIQFLVCGILSGSPALIFESPDLAGIFAAKTPVLYAGVMSCGVAYTLQIVGQKNMNPTVASLILSLESCISVIAGWLILGQNLSSREIFGCVLMFGAIILAQLPQKGTAF